MDTPNESRSERIEAYLLGELSPSEVQGLEAEMENDADFKAEVEAFRTLKSDMEFVEQNDFRNRLAAIQSELDQETAGDEASEEGVPSRIFRSPRWYMGFAAVVILLVIPLYFLLRPPLHQRLFNDNFEAYRNTLTSRGGDAETGKADAMASYEAGQFKESIPQFEAYLEAVPQDSPMIFYAGVAHLAEGNSERAIDLLSSVDERRFLYFYQVEWYLALAYIQAENWVMARRSLEFLILVGSSNKEKAQQLLEDFPTPGS